jgi:stearoyl-CoA desaturase (delta-9 desaturase)
MKLRDSAAKVTFNWRNSVWIAAVHVIALVCCIPFFSWQGLVVFAVMQYLVGMFGITFGFHRLISHKAFKTKAWIQNLAAFFGTLACQGGPVSWTGQHRIHHAYSDRHEDPHDSTKGFWYSHILFIFMRRDDLNRIEEVAHYCPDVAKNPYFMFLERYMIPIQFVFGFALMALGGLFGPAAGFDWHMALSVVVWGVFVRLVFGYHITWLVNSATHKWGSQPNKVADASRNNWWVGILAYGEGWHNNHHAQPRSARHGWRWWQLDQTWIFIKLLNRFKMVDNIILPKSK